MLIVAVLLLTACAPDADEGIIRRRDSAGVAIIETGTYRWRGGEPWTIEETPLLAIGSVNEGDAATQFSRISGVLVLADGRIVVADRIAAELRFFDQNGAHLLTAGRKGTGPGELGSFDRLLRLPGDTLLVASLMPPREILFAPDGRFVRAHGTPRISGASRPSATQHVLEDGTLIVYQGGFRILDGSSGSWTDSLALHAVKPRADSTTLIGSFPSARFTGNGEQVAQVAYSPRIVMTTSGSLLYVGFPERFEIRAYDADGRLRRIIRRPWTPLQVDQAAKDLYLAPFTGPDAPPSLRAVGSATTFAEVHPPYDHLLAGADGSLWARTITPALAAAGANPMERVAHGFRWSVFDSTGAWLGELDTPAGFEPTHIGRDRIVGIWRDEDGVAFVRVYGLHKSE